jgi:predicted RNA-binding Zn-ribbon protein involved in translation (DUF1610 family)
MAAGAPDGNPLPACPGAWLDPVPSAEVLELDAGDGELAIWGAMPPAVVIGQVDAEPGKVHVHHRPSADADKDVDASYSVVTVRFGGETLVIEGMAAVAFSVSELSGRDLAPLTCPHCGEIHIDEMKFATYPHAKHLCNSCGRNFRDRQPSISNPLADANKQLGLPPRPAAVRPDRPLSLSSGDYLGVSLFPSNLAIVSTSSRAEEVGIHVHAWDLRGEMVLDETYSSVDIDGVAVDEELMRILAVQRSLAHGAPIIAMACETCGADIVDGPDSYMEPTTHHVCGACGRDNRTRRRSFVNPLIRRFPMSKDDV